MPRFRSYRINKAVQRPSRISASPNFTLAGLPSSPGSNPRCPAFRNRRWRSRYRRRRESGTASGRAPGGSDQWLDVRKDVPASQMGPEPHPPGPRADRITRSARMPSSPGRDPRSPRGRCHPQRHRWARLQTRPYRRPTCRRWCCASPPQAASPTARRRPPAHWLESEHAAPHAPAADPQSRQDDPSPGLHTPSSTQAQSAGHRSEFSVSGLQTASPQAVTGCPDPPPVVTGPEVRVSVGSINSSMDPPSWRAGWHRRHQNLDDRIFGKVRSMPTDE
jgi:hypothetical protein